MKTPNIDNYNPDPVYLRELISKIDDDTLKYCGRPSIRAVAARIGVNESVMQKYLTPLDRKTSYPAPYSVQYILENLSKEKH